MSQWEQFRIKNTTYAFIAFFGIFVVVFLQKVCVFLVFISFFDEISNFCSRISPNQRHEQVIQSCQWNCMLIFSAFTFQRTSSINELLLLLFDGIWKVKAGYIVLCLDVSVKFQYFSRTFCHPAWMDNSWTCSHMSYSSFSPVNGLS